MTEPLQGQSKDDSLHIKLKLPSLGQLPQDFRQSLSLPESTEDQRRSPQARLARIDSRSLSRRKDAQVFREASQTSHEAIHLTVGREQTQTAQVGDDAMFGFALLSIRLYDLEIIMGMFLVAATLNPNKNRDIIKHIPDNKSPLYGTTISTKTTRNPHNLLILLDPIF